MVSEFLFVYTKSPRVRSTKYFEDEKIDYSKIFLITLFDYFAESAELLGCPTCQHTRPHVTDQSSVFAAPKLHAVMESRYEDRRWNCFECGGKTESAIEGASQRGTQSFDYASHSVSWVNVSARLRRLSVFGPFEGRKRSEDSYERVCQLRRRVFSRLLRILGVLMPKLDAKLTDESTTRSSEGDSARSARRKSTLEGDGARSWRTRRRGLPL